MLLLSYCFKHKTLDFQKALIVPPILELVTYWPDVTKKNITKNLLIIVFGLTGFTTGTYVSIKEVMNAFT